MSATVTLQVSDAVMERLRQQSKAEGRSIDEMAVRALVAGLKEPKESWWTDLGSLLAAAPTRQYDPERLHRLQKGLHVDPEDFLNELDWLRGPE